MHAQAHTHSTLTYPCRTTTLSVWALSWSWMPRVFSRYFGVLPSPWWPATRWISASSWAVKIRATLWQRCCLMARVRLGCRKSWRSIGRCAYVCFWRGTDTVKIESVRMKNESFLVMVYVCVCMFTCPTTHASAGTYTQLYHTSRTRHSILDDMTNLISPPHAHE